MGKNNHTGFMFCLIKMKEHRWNIDGTQINTVTIRGFINVPLCSLNIKVLLIKNLSLIK